MKTIKKLFKLFLIAITLGIIIIVLFYRQEAYRLYKVMTFFEPENISENFRQIDEIFPTRTVHRSTRPFTFPYSKNELQLPDSFKFNDSVINTKAYLDYTLTDALLIIQNDSIRGILSYYYGFDYAGYRQQKHKETSEAFLDYYNDTYMSKEFVKALYNIDVDLTSDYDIEIWNDPKIYSYFFSMSSLMGFQDLLMEEKKKTATTLINLIIKEKSLN